MIPHNTCYLNQTKLAFVGSAQEHPGSPNYHIYMGRLAKKYVKFVPLPFWVSYLPGFRWTRLDRAQLFWF